jgi:soluble lytic murein transglycosylase
VLVPPELRTLAARADQKQGWPALARYAKSAQNREIKGLAYFTLGYREYEAHADDAALDDLDRARTTLFSLADFATYYRAGAARDAGKLDLAAESLADFSSRYPSSTLRIDALRLQTFCLIGSNHAQDAVRILSAAPELHQQAPLEYLLGEAYSKAGNLPEAARTFQDIYYRLPGSPEAAPSGTALGSLQQQLGSNYSLPSDDLRATRAQGVEREGKYQAALDEYAALMRDSPSSPSLAEWRLGRDRCLMGLGRTNDAVVDLALTGWASGEVDAERGSLLVRGRARNNDEPGMRSALDELAHTHPASTAYAGALDSASFFFLRHADWLHASDFNQTLVQQFPASDLANKAEWEVAWAAYIGGHNDEARIRLIAYATHYPGSFRIPAALYWLGRLDEPDRPSEAAWCYRALQSRFGYYALRAAERLKALGPAASPGVSGTSESAAPAGLPPGIGRTPALPEDVNFCPTSATGDVERPGLVLAALSLDDLGIRYLRARLGSAKSDTSGSATETSRLRLGLARIERDQQKFDDATLSAKRALPNYVDYEFSALPFDFWNLLYPEAFWDLVRQNARLSRVDPYLVMALIRQESGFNPKAVSGPGARGLMQLRPPTARAVQRESSPRGRSGAQRKTRAGNLNNANYNLREGCRYLSDMIKDFGGSLEQALAAYNAGPERVREWLSGHSYPEPAAFVESIPFPETRAYVEALLRDQAVYQRLLQGQPKFKSCGAKPAGQK